MFLVCMYAISYSLKSPVARQAKALAWSVLLSAIGTALYWILAWTYTKPLFWQLLLLYSFAAH